MDGLHVRKTSPTTGGQLFVARGEKTVLLHVDNGVGHSPETNLYLSFPLGLDRPHLSRQIYPACFSEIHRFFLEMQRSSNFQSITSKVRKCYSFHLLSHCQQTNYLWCKVGAEGYH